MSSAEAFKIYSESDEVSVDMPGQSNSKFCSRQTLEFERLQTLLSVEKQERIPLGPYSSSQPGTQ